MIAHLQKKLDSLFDSFWVEERLFYLPLPVQGGTFSKSSVARSQQSACEEDVMMILQPVMMMSLQLE